MTYVNKDVYSGNWRGGQKNGQGTYVFEATKMKFVGKWNMGEIESGQWKYPNGTYFQGIFNKN
jgi:hypothetical protein